MRKEYDFSNAVRGKFYRPNKVQKTIRLDEDIVEYFKEKADKQKTGYQTLINSALRESIEHPSGIVDKKLLHSELKSTMKEVLKEAHLV